MCFFLLEKTPRKLIRQHSGTTFAPCPPSISSTCPSPPLQLGTPPLDRALPDPQRQRKPLSGHLPPGLTLLHLHTEAFSLPRSVHSCSSQLPSGRKAGGWPLHTTLPRPCPQPVWAHVSDTCCSRGRYCVVRLQSSNPTVPHTRTLQAPGPRSGFYPSSQQQPQLLINGKIWLIREMNRINTLQIEP